MPRIIYWNIQNFAEAKMQTDLVDAAILSIVYPVLGGPATADMLVVVEVGAQNTALGAIPATTGPAGVDLLRVMLQARNPNWRCVPPISTAAANGKSEAVGVYYLDDVFTFTGPHVWSDFGPLPLAQIGATVAPWTDITAGADAAHAPFPPPWNVGAFAGGAPSAPQIHYLDPLALGFIEFPEQGCRRPLRCQFTYGPAGASLLDLWAVHMPPNGAEAREATYALAGLPDISAAQPPNTMRLVCGDFNLKSNDPWQYDGYFGMLIRGFTPAIGSRPNSLAPLGTITFFNKAKPLATNYLTGGRSIDNMLITMPAALPPFSVVNQVAAGVAPWGSSLNVPLATILLWDEPMRSQQFRSWANFGHIGNRPKTANMNGLRGASDHMPLFVEL